MTKELANVSRNVIAYEIDNELRGQLNLNLSNYDNVDILFKDFLLSDINEDISSYNYTNL